MRDFAALFRGRDDAHGKYFSLAGRQPTDRGKIVSKAESLREAVTPELFKDHLTGKDRLGIIPVMADGCVNWFVLDVDFYKVGQKTLAEVSGYQKIAAAISKTPLVMTASKSGGAHLWCFLETPLQAQVAHKIATTLLEKINLPKVLGINPEEFKQHLDIFPKDFSPDNIGSWVNLPYFGEECHCLGEDGNGNLSLVEFVQYANARLMRPEELKQRKTKGSERPPCIDYMLEHGVPEGHRNDACFQAAIYALKAYPDTWKEFVSEFNDTACQPPLRQDELSPIFKSVGLKQYEGYLCNKIKDIFCDKTECKKRAFGVGKEPIGDLGIEHIEKIDGENPVYLITLDGKTFDCQLDQLYNYSVFRKCALGVLNRFLPNMKQPEWEDILADYLEMMEVTEAAADTQMRDRVIRAFQNWCSQCCVTDDFEAALAANAPYYDGKTIIFSGDALLSQLDRQLSIKREDAYIYMRGWGTTMIDRYGQRLWCWVQHGPLWFDPMKGKKK